MIVSLTLLLIAVLIVARARHRGPAAGAGTAVRRFFQFLIFGAMEGAVAIGATGLLTRVLDRAPLAVDDRATLARDLALVVVGTPALLIVGTLTRRHLRADPLEARSAGWALVLGFAELTAATVTLLALQDLVVWILGASTFDPGAAARAVAWGAVWGAQVRLDARTRDSAAARSHRLAVAVIALWTMATGLASLVTAAILGVLPVAPLAEAGTPPTVRAFAALLVGAAVWSVLWRRVIVVQPVSVAQRAYLVIAGVGGGTIAAIAGAAVVVDRLLVWWLGTPESSDLTVTVRASAGAVGAFVAGVAVRQVHVALLAHFGSVQRDEPQRVVDYATTGIALGALGAAGMVLTAALLETLTQGVALAGPPARNTLLLAVTLLLVGGPLWAVRWRGIRAALTADPAGERASVSRRVLLITIFGVVGLAAVVALIVAVAFAFDDVVSARLGMSTLRRARWPLGVVVSAGLLAGAHWRVYRTDHAATAGAPRRQVLVVGPLDGPAVTALASQLGVRVDVVRTTGPAARWDAHAIASAVEAHDALDVVVVPGADGPHVFTRLR